MKGGDVCECVCEGIEKIKFFKVDKLINTEAEGSRVMSLKTIMKVTA